MRFGVSRASLLGAVFVSVTLMSATAKADPCKLTTIGGINFGNYDPLSPVPLSTMGSFGYSCPPGQGSPLITISAGTWGTFASRAMQNPTDPAALLQYNLYVDAACTMIWGDGTSGTSTQVGPAGQTQTIPVFARLPALQNVSAGTFTDTVVVTFNF
jgi:spore coat protein U-like protein